MLKAAQNVTSWTAGAWSIDVKRFHVLSPEEAAAAFCQDGLGGGPVKVEHPSKGGLGAVRLKNLVHKGLRVAEVGGGYAEGA